jgi:hypothetical protein
MLAAIAQTLTNRPSKRTLKRARHLVIATTVAGLAMTVVDGQITLNRLEKSKERALAFLNIAVHVTAGYSCKDLTGIQQSFDAKSPIGIFAHLSKVLDGKPNLGGTYRIVGTHILKATGSQTATLQVDVSLNGGADRPIIIDNPSPNCLATLETK